MGRRRREYPKLKVGDIIRCQSQEEAQTLGTALQNEGFDYISTGRKLTIVKRGLKDEKGLKKDCKRD